MNCNNVPASSSCVALWFQSLIGILMNCNSGGSSGSTTKNLFQSLIGILMNCNNDALKQKLDSLKVSIPNRDFDELQLDSTLNT